MGAGGSKKVKQDLDAARAKQNNPQQEDDDNVSQVMNFDDSNDNNNHNKRMVHHDLLYDDDNEMDDVDSQTLLSQQKWNMANDLSISDYSDDPKSGSVTSSPKRQHNEKKLSPKNNKNKDVMLLEDVRTPPSSSSSSKVKKKKNENCYDCDDLDDELGSKISSEVPRTPTSKSGSRKGSRLRANSSDERTSSRGGSSMRSREKKEQAISRTGSRGGSSSSSRDVRELPSLKRLGSRDISESEKEHLLDMSRPKLSNVPSSFRTSNLTTRTPPPNINNRKKSDSSLFTSPIQVNESPNQSQRLNGSKSDNEDEEKIEANKFKKFEFSPQVDVTPITKRNLQNDKSREQLSSPTSKIKSSSPPKGGKGSRSSYKSPLALSPSRVVVPPSPSYQPKKHEDRLHKLQLHNLESMNDDLLPSSSPVKDTQSGFDDVDEDEEDVPTYSTLTPSFQKVSAESASLLELQRKRTLSSMENAKLEMEVESLMKQLAQLDALEEAEEMEIQQMTKLASNVVGTRKSEKGSIKKRQPAKVTPSDYSGHSSERDENWPTYNGNKRQSSRNRRPSYHDSQDQEGKTDVVVDDSMVAPEKGDDKARLNIGDKVKTRQRRNSRGHQNMENSQAGSKNEPPSHHEQYANNNDHVGYGRPEAKEDKAILEEKRRKMRAAAREEFLLKEKSKSENSDVLGKLLQKDSGQNYTNRTPPNSGRKKLASNIDVNGSGRSSVSGVSDMYTPDFLSGGRNRVGSNFTDEQPLSVLSVGSERESHVKGTSESGGNMKSSAQCRPSRIGRLAHLNKVNNRNNNLGTDLAQEHVLDVNKGGSILDDVPKSGRNKSREGGLVREFSQYEGSKASLEQNGSNGNVTKNSRDVNSQAEHNDFDIEESPREQESSKKIKKGYVMPSHSVSDEQRKLSVSPIRRRRLSKEKAVDSNLLKMNGALVVGSQPSSDSSNAPKRINHINNENKSVSNISDSNGNMENIPSKKVVKSRSVLKNLNKRRHHSLHPDAPHVSSDASLDISFDESSVEGRSLADQESQQSLEPVLEQDKSEPYDKPAPLQEMEGGTNFKGVAALKRKGRSKIKPSKKMHGIQEQPLRHDNEGESGSKSVQKDKWSETMDMRRMEVELLLRRPINSDADIDFTLASAEAGLIFMDELNRVAKSLNILRGTLSRWLLPFDNNTAISDQASNFQSVVDSMPTSFRGKLTEKQVHYLVSGLNSVRQLIRVKIADDNDLEQARAALRTAADFLKRLQDEAESESPGVSAYDLLQSRPV